MRAAKEALLVVYVISKQESLELFGVWPVFVKRIVCCQHTQRSFRNELKGGERRKRRKGSLLTPTPHYHSGTTARLTYKPPSKMAQPSPTPSSEIIHLVSTFADTLDSLPPSLTRSLSDLKELDAVLSGKLPFSAHRSSSSN